MHDAELLGPSRDDRRVFCGDEGDGHACLSQQADPVAVPRRETLEDLAVGAVGFAGRRVVRAADRYRNDPRRLDVQLRKIFVQLVGMVATAKL